MESLFALLLKPSTLAVIEKAGQALVTFANHNPKLLGNAQGAVAAAGQTVEEVAALGSTV